MFVIPRQLPIFITYCYFFLLFIRVLFLATSIFFLYITYHWHSGKKSKRKEKRTKVKKGNFLTLYFTNSLNAVSFKFDLMYIGLNLSINQYNVSMLELQFTV